MDVVTAEQLDAMTPDERQAVSKAATVRDLTDLPEHLQRLVDRAQTFVVQREAGQRAAS